MKPNTLKIEFICGMTFTANGNLLEPSTVEAARREAQAFFLRKFGGFSQLVVTGAWRSPATGKTAHDASIVYTVLAHKDAVTLEDLNEIQRRLAADFYQESVPYVVTEVFCKF